MQMSRLDYLLQSIINDSLMFLERQSGSAKSKKTLMKTMGVMVEEEEKGGDGRTVLVQ